MEGRLRTKTQEVKRKGGKVGELYGDREEGHVFEGRKAAAALFL